MSKLLVFVELINPRISYIFDLIFHQLHGMPVELTTDLVYFDKSDEPKLIYAKVWRDKVPTINPHTLLFEKGIKYHPIVVTKHDGVPIFFQRSKSAVPYDPFAASFYMVSRYEEYLPFACDKLGRFVAENSLAYENGFLNRPVVNIWSLQVKAMLLNYFPQLSFKENHYHYVSTMDIDNAYAFLEKGIIRTSGALLKSFAKLDFKQIKNRLLVLAKKRRDPYDTYDYIFELHNKFKVKSIFFFLLGDYGENDRNVSIARSKFRSLIKLIADYAVCGIHPSYASNDDPEKIGVEISRLKRVLKREVTKSRQHFLRLGFPITYRRLISYDIKDDYTMGFAQQPGFRAGICSTFYFYDLDLELATKLAIHPFMIMDATFRYYLKVSPEKALEAIVPLIDEVKSVNGTFISLWHNESLSDVNPWKGWKNLYGQMLQRAVPND